MSLFNDASLLLTANAYKTSKCYAIKPDDGSADCVYTRSGTKYRQNSAGLLEALSANVPPLDYSYQSCPGWNQEPQRTNLCLRSNDIANAAWTKDSANGGSAPVITSAYAASIFDGESADRIQLVRTSGAGSYSAVYQSIAVSSGQTYTASVWVKAVTGTPNISFVTDGTSWTPGLITVTNQWVRYSVTFTAGSTTVLMGFDCEQGVNSSLSVDILATGFQLELGGSKTSNIKTAGTTATRTADKFQKTSASSVIGQTEGTVVLWTYLPTITGQPSTNPNLITLTDGVDNLNLYITPSGGVTAEMSGGCSISLPSYGLTAGMHKFAFGYKLNSFVLYIDGVQAGTDTSGTVPTLDEYNLGYAADLSYTPQQYAQLFALFTTKLTPTQLANITTL